MKAKKIISILAAFFISVLCVSCEKKQMQKKNIKSDKNSVIEKNEQAKNAEPSDEQKMYDAAEQFFDEKKYEEAIQEYMKVVNRTDWLFQLNEEKKAKVSSESGLQFDSNGEINLLYYSLYNIACCHSLMGNFAEAKKYLIAALHAGYPHLNHILNDSDMKPFFLSDSSLKSEITKIYNLGNSKSLVNGKKFEQWNTNDCQECGFDGDTAIMYLATSDWLDHKLKGTYEVKNYHILMHFYKVSYRKPDPWASPRPGAAMITEYTSYSEYPETKDVDFTLTLRFPLGLSDGDGELKEISSSYMSDWQEKDYSEEIAKRIEEYYSVKRKIERTDEEITASAARRRQRVLDYIAKVGENDPTVFIVPEGTKELVDCIGMDIPDGTVAVLLPEGLEFFSTKISSSVKYINFPSTLKILCPWFSSDSKIEPFEIPENLEKLTTVLFFYNPDDDKKWEVYVPGYSETPPDWDQSWDMYCNVHWGEYQE